MAIQHSTLCLSDPAQASTLASIEAIRPQLSADERDELNKRKRPEAIAEYLATRWIARKLGEKIVPNTASSDWHVVKAIDGRPALESRHGGCLYLSISHKHPWVAVAASDSQPVGIDIEKVPEFTSPVQERSWIQSIASAGFASQELDSMHDQTVYDLIRRWTQKEAIAKATSQVGLAGLRSIDTRRIESMESQERNQFLWRSGNHNISLWCGQLDPKHFMTLAWQAINCNETFVL
jgi:phosphopantetheine--protein transferase-like protein